MCTEQSLNAKKQCACSEGLIVGGGITGLILFFKRRGCFEFLHGWFRVYIPTHGLGVNFKLFYFQRARTVRICVRLSVQRVCLPVH